MRTYTSPHSLQRAAEQWRAAGYRIGVVPTMGALHDGHLSLVRRARKDCDRVVLTLFVNPTQFAPGEDLSTYPQTVKADKRAAKALGVDAVFLPAREAMYPAGFQTTVSLGDMTERYEGAERPTHFDGVTTIVAKLFNISCAHRAYFGQKDAQQAALVTRLAEDLNFDVKIVVCPIVRESDGLAMSSRNVYLGEAERKQAACLHEALLEARRLVGAGEKRAATIQTAMRRIVRRRPLAKLDYAAVVDTAAFRKVNTIEGRALAVLAVRFGATRLLDNMELNLPEQRRVASTARDRKG